MQESCQGMAWIKLAQVMQQRQTNPSVVLVTFKVFSTIKTKI